MPPMRSPPTPSNPIDVAHESLRMDRETGDKTFRLMAIGMMVITAVATGVHALHSLWRDVRGRREGHEYGHGDRRSYSGPEEPTYRSYERGGAPSRDDEPEPARRWSGREERRGRTAEVEERRTDYRREHGQGRER
jgi:hypothetical protein